MIDLLGTTSARLYDQAREAFGGAKGAGPAGAIHREATRNGRFEPERHGLGRRAAERWRRIATLSLPEALSEDREETASGPLTRSVLRLSCGRSIETVRLPMGRGRSSLCLSTQVGCARACTFCETGRQGLRRNLTAGEITGQVTLAALRRRPDNLVFMGMGEPLDNLEGLLGALDVLTDRRGLSYAQERLTVSTVGHVPGLERLRELGWKRLGLALSLHAADDTLRSELMPRAARYPVAEIQRALIAYRMRANLALGIHWCLLPGINDSPADADALARFCAPLGRVHVHLIPYNPTSAPIARPPREDEVVRFVGLLRDRGLAVRRRITKGRSIAAACGQLAGRLATT